jgi:hypothetical protein
VISIISAMAAMENQLGVARKLQPAGEFPLQRFDGRERMIDARQAEGWTFRRAVATTSFDPSWKGRSALERMLLDIFVRPYARLCAIERSSDELRNSVVMRRVDRCNFDPPKAADDTSRFPNPINTDSMSDAAKFAVRANRMLLDFEGTEKIQLLKRDPSADVTRSMSPHRRWVFDGRTLRLEPEVPLKLPLPTQHTTTAGRTSS